MKVKSLLAAMTIGLGSIASLPAAAAAITTPDGVKSPWAGFDWASDGTAFTTGFTGIAEDEFSLTVFSAAANLNRSPSGTFLGLDLDSNMDGLAEDVGWYEYTLVATINEKIVSCTATSCDFAVLNGTFNIYYDTTPDANMSAGSLGTGFDDGVVIISGVFGAQDGGTFTTSGNGSNSTTLKGNVTFTNATYINPALVTTTATTTLQLGDAQTAWTDPGGFDGTAWAGGEIVLQADANQNFSVPEPATVGLLGVALAGLALTRRRKDRAQA